MESNTPAALMSTPTTQSNSLDSEWFQITDVPEGSSRLVGGVAVFNVAGHLCATQAKCPHKYGLLIEGHVAGSTVTCPWHGSEFDVCTGAVLREPAVRPLQTYRVIVEGDRARVENMQQTDAK